MSEIWPEDESGIHPDLRTPVARLAPDAMDLFGDGPVLSRAEIIGTVRELGDGLLEEGLVHRVRRRPEYRGRPMPDVSGLLSDLGLDG